MPEVERTIAKRRGAAAGPTLVVVGGVHGNEPAGVRAACRVVGDVPDRAIHGEVVALAGNTRALAENKRYLVRDLNRQWSADRLADLDAGRVPDDAESREARELRAALDAAVAAARGPVYFLDLHTTSAEGVPFGLIGDTQRHRAFAARFPLPVILGLEEQVDGVLAEYMSARGATTLSVEGGQHANPGSQGNLEAVVRVALWAAGVASRDDVPSLDAAIALLERARGHLPHLIEVLSRHAITDEHEFRMEPGFANIQRARAGELLARDRRGEIRAPHDGMVLLPLYQAQGDEGFFYGREVSPLRQRVCGALRRYRLDALLPLLPGVRGGRDELEVAPGAADLYPSGLFSLFGYRQIRPGERGLVYRRRSP
ncbi:MAG TPA: succinylglutamate desuccinylase/aspartoacylase family protein [Haliangiales bacterium]|nr:succinylglutamate desuccinylase/aspartoacylase family protein [Haliangiales bacterium]